MGITGLLPLLKGVSQEKTLADYRGETLAVDGYCWLHQVMHRCSEDTFLDPKSERYIDYFMARVDNLVRHGVSPYIVFDGGSLPSKAHTEEARRLARQNDRAKAMQFLSQNNKEQARKHFSRAIDISPYMAHRVILVPSFELDLVQCLHICTGRQRLRQKNIKYVVAPYEADAQLAYLVKCGLVNGVITEDSDCLVFDCNKVVFKMDWNGKGQEIKVQSILRNSEPNMQGFTHDMFMEMCIFSGCDYLANIPRLGLKTSYNLFRKYGSVRKVLRNLRLEGKVKVPASYEEDFAKAKLTFKHQRVYDPLNKKLVFLSSPPDDLKEQIMDWCFLGPEISDANATAIAIGDMDPITMTYFGKYQCAVPIDKHSFPSIRDKSVASNLGSNDDRYLVPSSSLSCATDREEIDSSTMSSQSQEASNDTKIADKVMEQVRQKVQEETAFDRMMRAGSQLQKQSLKRKRKKTTNSIPAIALKSKSRFFGLQPQHSTRGDRLSTKASTERCKAIPQKIAKAGQIILNLKHSFPDLVDRAMILLTVSRMFLIQQYVIWAANMQHVNIESYIKKVPISYETTNVPVPNMVEQDYEPWMDPRSTCILPDRDQWYLNGRCHLSMLWKPYQSPKDRVEFPRLQYECGGEKIAFVAIGNAGIPDFRESDAESKRPGNDKEAFNAIHEQIPGDVVEAVKAHDVLYDIYLGNNFNDGIK
uniref:Exonuclease 1 putative n=1 Tax=Albugo laibachii Nc14 TaxID=890382 RepID=F0W678_9STRA|nr:exonuclease 1 putative [Albugo laibachii Nc14]|eukprot:CCA16620.1 exonuclease 1 putative [Albugo laibachii Nc14]